MNQMPSHAHAEPYGADYEPGQSVTYTMVLRGSTAHTEVYKK